MGRGAAVCAGVAIVGAILAVAVLPRRLPHVQAHEPELEPVS